jgi:Leucine-rich repeat (LRR) protein
MTENVSSWLTSNEHASFEKDSEGNVVTLCLNWRSERPNRDDPEFPTRIIKSMKHLQTLELKFSPHRTLPGDIFEPNYLTTSLTELDIQYCHKWTELPWEIGRLEKLEKCTLHCCRGLRSLPPEIGRWQSLQDLRLSDLRHVRTLPTEFGASCPNLRTLEIEKSHIFDLPTNLLHLQSLKLSSMWNLRAIPNQICGDLTSLKVVICPSLETIPIASLVNLKTLEVLSSSSLNAFPNDISQLTQLTHLLIEESFDLSVMPTDGEFWRPLQSLEVLKLSDMIRQSKSLPILGEELVNLRELSLMRFSDISSQWRPTNLPKLRHLDLSFCRKAVVRKYFETNHNLSLTMPLLEKLLLIDCKLETEELRVVLPCLAGTNVDYLDLNENELDELDCLLSANLPRGIHFLALSENPIVDSSKSQDQSGLERLLDRYTQLKSVDCTPNDSLMTPYAAYLLCLNKAGRILLRENRDKRLPLSVWACVLDRAQTVAAEGVYNESMIPSVLYGLLQGSGILNTAAQWRHNYTPRKRKADSTLTAD